MDQLKDRQKMNWEAMFYSSQRIDILIIAICGTGIYVCLETLKFLKENCIETSLLIKLSGIAFVVGIIINFISQFLSRKANEYDFLMSQMLLDNNENLNDIEEIEYKKYQDNSEKYTKHTDLFNYLSAAFMSLGLILIMIYFMFIF